MNRYSTINYILMMKDAGMKDIFVDVCGQRYQVPTRHSGEASSYLSSVMDSNDDAAVYVPELKTF